MGRYKQCSQGEGCGRQQGVYRERLPADTGPSRRIGWQGQGAKGSRGQGRAGMGPATLGREWKGREGAEALCSEAS